MAHALGFRCGKAPAVSTPSRTLRRFDAQQLEAIMWRWIRGRVEPTTREPISIDGKALRGRRGGEVPGQHLVAAYAPAVAAVFAQVRVDSKTDEHKAAPQLLAVLPLEGQVVIGDAMFCPRDVAEHFVETRGGYVLVAKDNQPGLGMDIQAGFAFEAAADPSRRPLPPSPPPGRIATSCEKGHGRIEKRTLETPILTAGDKWKGVPHGFRITRA